MANTTLNRDRLLAQVMTGIHEAELGLAKSRRALLALTEQEKVTPGSQRDRVYGAVRALRGRGERAFIMATATEADLSYEDASNALRSLWRDGLLNRIPCNVPG